MAAFPNISAVGLRRDVPPRTKTLSWVIIVGLIILVITIDMKRRAVQNALQKLTVRVEELTGNQQQNQEAAKEIIAKVGRLYALPPGIEPTVAKIVDVNALKARNPFYAKAENGDYLVVTPERAILYSTSRNIILDVVPVQIQQAGAGGAVAGGAAGGGQGGQQKAPVQVQK